MTLRARCIAVGLLLLLPLGVQRMSAQTSEAQTSQGGSIATQVPPLIQFASVATDEGGNTLSGLVSMTFSLFAGQRGGEALWSETQRVQLDAAGRYSVQLGVTKRTGVPSALFASGETRWLGVRIAEQPEQARVLLVSVPYALKAGDAATIGGLPPSAFVLAAPNAVMPGTTSFAPGSPEPNTAVTGTGSANFIPLWDTATDIVSSALFQTGSGATAKIGINTTTPTATLDVKGGEVVEGLLSLPAASTATAARGGNSQALSFTASAFNSGTSNAVNQIFRWKAEPVANDTAAASASLNLLYGSGNITPAETGLQINSKGLFTFAPGQTFPGTGSGTVTNVGFTAPPADFVVSGSPVTVSGTLGLVWKKVPTSANTATAIVKRDATGGFSAGAISATQLGVAGTISTGGLAASGTITAGAMGLGTPSPTERLDMGIDGNIVIKTDPGNDSTPDNAGYKLIGRDYFGANHTWAMLTAPVGGGFGVPPTSFSIWEYPPSSPLGCCFPRLNILPVTNTYTNVVTISGLGFLGVGTTFPGAPLDVFTDGTPFATDAILEGEVLMTSDLTVDGCVIASGNVVAGTCTFNSKLMKNVQPFPLVLDKLTRLQPVTYNWKTEELPQLHLGTGKNSGLIAEDVERVFPEMVAADKKGLKSVNSGALPYLLLQAIRELKAENDSLRERVMAQEKRTRVNQSSELEQLRAEVKRLAGIVEARGGEKVQAKAVKTGFSSPGVGPASSSGR